MYVNNYRKTIIVIYFFLFFFQEYHTQIDELKRELDAARNKDGVFLPKEKYDEQLRSKEVADNIIREKTLQLKALEEDLENFNVSFFSIITYRFNITLLYYLVNFLHNIYFIFFSKFLKRLNVTWKKQLLNGTKLNGIWKVLGSYSKKRLWKETNK